MAPRRAGGGQHERDWRLACAQRVRDGHSAVALSATTPGVAHMFALLSFARVNAACCLLLALCSTGCAAGNEYNYRGVHLPHPFDGTGKLAIAVHDQRPDVIEDSCSPDVVGVQRSAIGIPWDVTTESGHALAEDWGAVVGSALRRGGFSTTVVKTSPHEPWHAVLRRLQATGAQSLLLFSVYEWRSDSYQDVTLHYDVVLGVFSPAGSLVAATRSTGEDDLGGMTLDITSFAEKEVPAAFQRKLEWMLGALKVVTAVQRAAGRPLKPRAPAPSDLES